MNILVANKIRINKYKWEYIIKLVGVYIRQKLHLTVDSMSTKIVNINVKWQKGMIIWLG